MSKKIKVAAIANIIHGLIIMALLVVLVVSMGIVFWNSYGMVGFILFTGLIIIAFVPYGGGYGFLMISTGAQLLRWKKNPNKLLRPLVLCKVALLVITLFSEALMIYNLGATFEWMSSGLIITVPQAVMILFDLPACFEKVEKNS